MAVHEFMDSTKAACPDLRHRLVLHNADLGPELAARAFPGRPDARTVAVRYVAEDLGFAPTLAEWLAGCDPGVLPRPLSRRSFRETDSLPGDVARAQGLGDDAGPHQVLDLLKLPVDLAGPGALAVLCNGAGPMVVRAVLGPPRAARGRHGGETVFDPAHCAEAMIHWWFGTIPPLVDVVAALVRSPVLRCGTTR